MNACMAYFFMGIVHGISLLIHVNVRQSLKRKCSNIQFVCFEIVRINLDVYFRNFCQTKYFRYNFKENY